MRHNATPEANRVGLIAREVVGEAAGARVHLGATERLLISVFIDGHLHERRPAEEHLRRASLHHHVVAHARHVGAARGAASEHHRDGGDTRARELREVLEAGAAEHEDLGLLGEVGPGRLGEAQ